MAKNYTSQTLFDTELQIKIINIETLISKKNATFSQFIGTFIGTLKKQQLAKRL